MNNAEPKRSACVHTFVLWPFIPSFSPMSGAESTFLLNASPILTPFAVRIVPGWRSLHNAECKGSADPSKASRQSGSGNGINRWVIQILCVPLYLLLLSLLHHCPQVYAFVVYCLSDTYICVAQHPKPTRVAAIEDERITIAPESVLLPKLPQRFSHGRV